MRADGARRIRPAVAVQTLFVLFGVFIAASFPFLSLFLDGKGLTAGEIGAVIAAMAIARVLLSPLWGHLADTTLGRRLPRPHPGFERHRRRQRPSHAHHPGVRRRGF